ncbi:MAG: hypothetical protein MZW92_67695 [Comamonadaceae bacterium]|nr:hypothetical protein [Comamonadaceae bacterium]
MESWKQRRPHATTASRARCASDMLVERVRVWTEEKPERPFHAIVRRPRGPQRGAGNAQATTATTRTRCGASRRATASRTSRSTC